MYAIIRIKGKQYKVNQGDEILVDRLAPKEKVDPEVLLLVDKDKVEVGKPTLSKAKISLKRLDDEKGEKLHVFKYKSKSKYRRKLGFRPQFTRLQVSKLSLK